MAEDTTQLLAGASAGDAAAAAQLMPLVYDELRGLAQRYLAGGAGRGPATLQPTAVVHEAYLRLAKHDAAGINGRTHFFAIAATAMRQVLIDHARARGRAKRGGDWERVSLTDVCAFTAEAEVDFAALDEALRGLAELDPRGARVVELRFFGGLTELEIADLLGISERTVRNDWSAARAWLATAMAENDSRDGR